MQRQLQHGLDRRRGSSCSALPAGDRDQETETVDRPNAPSSAKDVAAPLLHYLGLELNSALNGSAGFGCPKRAQLPPLSPSSSRRRRAIAMTRWMAVGVSTDKRAASLLGLFLYKMPLPDSGRAVPSHSGSGWRGGKTIAAVQQRAVALARALSQTLPAGVEAPREGQSPDREVEEPPSPCGPRRSPVTVVVRTGSTTAGVASLIREGTNPRLLLRRKRSPAHLATHRSRRFHRRSSVRLRAVTGCTHSSRIWCPAYRHTNCRCSPTSVVHALARPLVFAPHSLDVSPRMGMGTFAIFGGFYCPQGWTEPHRPLWVRPDQPRANGDLAFFPLSSLHRWHMF